MDDDMSQEESDEPQIAEEPQSEEERFRDAPLQDGIAASIEDLQRRCEFLLAELKGFADHLRQLGRENAVELKGPSAAVEAELKALKKLSGAEESDEVKARSKHIIRSSNIPYHEVVWATAKRTSGVIAFNKRFFWQNPKSLPGKDNAKSKYKHSALVDIVAQDGAEWIKVSTVTETRLLFELARQGWATVDDSDDSDDENRHVLTNNHSASNASNPDDKSDSDGDDDDQISILRMAEQLRKAARATRIRYRHPSVRFVLPNLHPNNHALIDRVLASLHRTGATVTAGRAAQSPSDVATPPLPAALAALTVDPFAAFTCTLNVDCTILLALASDLSHAQVPCQPWFHRATARQIEMEAAGALLPRALYPAMGARALVCTRAAAARMRDIVRTIGTPSERARGALLLGERVDPAVDPRLAHAHALPRGAPQPALVAALQALSEYPVPGELQLPIRTVDGDGDGDAGAAGLPVVAAAVATRLSAINRSVFLHGWRARITTITSNRTVARQIEETIEAEQERRGSGQGWGAEDGEGGEDALVGPHVWLCPMARSLVGKEKGRAPG